MPSSVSISFFSNAWMMYLNRILKRQRTLPAEKVSLVLHEPGILSGYRVPYQPWIYYIKSIFQVHNETVNIWTHIIGSLIILQQVYIYVSIYNATDSKLSVTVLASGYSFFLTVAVSSVVHVLHSRSAYHHFMLFMIDYLSAAFCLYGTGMFTMYGVSDPNFYATIGDWYLLCQAVSTYVVFLTVCVSKLWYGMNPHDMRRKYMLLLAFTVHGLINSAPTIPRYLQCYNSSVCSLHSLNHLSLPIVLTVLQGIVYGSHQPERMWPGRFDIFGHSHQLFHVLTTISHVTQFGALYLDYTNGLTRHCQPDAFRVFLATFSVTFAGVLTLLYLIRFVPKSLLIRSKEQ